MAKWHNALLVKPSEHITKFFDTDVSSFGGSDFTVSKWALGRVTLLEIDHMERAACDVVLASLKNIRAKIYAIQHKAYSRKKGHVWDFSEERQINVNEGENIRKFGQKCWKTENILKKHTWLHAKNC